MAQAQAGNRFSVGSMNRLEELRRSFRPDRISTLFVGESAPRSGRFFYSGDSGLYRAMQSAFNWEGDFLTEFKAKGFYLDDLSLIPVNGMKPKERARQCEESIAPFSLRLKELRPSAIVILVRSIDKSVRKAMQNASLSIPIHNTTYPGRYQQLKKRFANEMASIIPQLPEVRPSTHSAK
jgi:hypothetical protein